jgi:uncharacterized protein YecE (DUF72 family)
VSVAARVGTSGFSYDAWKGNFYPEKIASKDMLHFYAQRFPTVEINNTFYRMPREDVLSGWGDQVPESFRFVIKASQRITHIKRLRECGEPLAYLYRVTTALGPRLGPLLFQLPPNFRKDLERLAGFFAARPDRRRVAIEFRHASWFDDEVFGLLREQGVALCVSDTGEEPVVPLVATADWGYLRLRREEFGEAELRDWARRIGEQPWSEAFVFLKHEEEGIGPKLAARLIELLAEGEAPAAARPSAPGAREITSPAPAAARPSAPAAREIPPPQKAAARAKVRKRAR